MKKPSVFVAAMALSLYAGTAIAAPICAALTTPDTMPKRYAKYAPVFSDGPEGWIIDQDQMKDDFAPSKESVALLKTIVQEFNTRGVPLAVLIPPPRPLVAGAETLSELGADTNYDVEQVGQSFTALIDSLHQAEIVAPDLLKLALSDNALQDNFYFRRDTHWTPTGAAYSALALAKDIHTTYPARFPNAGSMTPKDLAQGPAIDEEGSLANIARNVCKTDLAPETVETLIFPTDSDALLQDDTGDKPVVALAGSSFSDRYKRDFYRMADSLAGALDAEIENYSVSGGGPIGGLESLILSGDLSSDRFDLVIWELPYSERFRSSHFLRQLLGALRYNSTTGKATTTVSIDEHSQNLTLDLSASSTDTVVLHLPESEIQRVTAHLHSPSSKKKTIKLVRKNRVPAERRSHTWAVSLEGLKARNFTQMTLEFTDATPGKNATAILLP